MLMPRVIPLAASCGDSCAFTPTASQSIRRTVMQHSLFMRTFLFCADGDQSPLGSYSCRSQDCRYHDNDAQRLPGKNQVAVLNPFVPSIQGTSETSESTRKFRLSQLMVRISRAASIVSDFIARLGRDRRWPTRTGKIHKKPLSNLTPMLQTRISPLRPGRDRGLSKRAHELSRRRRLLSAD